MMVRIGVRVGNGAPLSVASRSCRVRRCNRTWPLNDFGGRRCRSRRGKNGFPDGRLREMGTDHGRFAGPLFEGFVPGQCGQRNGEDEFEEEAHGGQ